MGHGETGKPSFLPNLAIQQKLDEPIVEPKFVNVLDFRAGDRGNLAKHLGMDRPPDESSISIRRNDSNILLMFRLGEEPRTEKRVPNQKRGESSP
jgi:hypothetical protein